MYLKELWKRISNTKSIMAIVGEVLTVAFALGIDLPDDRIKMAVLAICQILVIVGVFNKSGMDTDKFNK